MTDRSQTTVDHLIVARASLAKVLTEVPVPTTSQMTCQDLAEHLSELRDYLDAIEVIAMKPVG